MIPEVEALASVLLVWFVLSCLAGIVWATLGLIFRGRRR